MILVDASIWGDHFRSTDARLIGLLDGALVLVHPAIIGELALSNLKHRREKLDLLQSLPRATAASDEEVLSMIEAASLHSRGIGWVDAHLLASARLTPCRLWTRDGALRAAALHVHVATHSG